MTLSRDAILAANDSNLVSVDVPEWGGSVFVRPMTGAERDEYDLEMAGDAKLKNIRGRLAVRVVCDESGARLFKDSDAEALGTKSASALDRIYDAMQKASKTRAQDISEAKKD